jgi:hypothetical protein
MPITLFLNGEHFDPETTRVLYKLAIKHRVPRIASFGRTSVANILLRIFCKAVVIERNCEFTASRMADHVSAAALA